MIVHDILAVSSIVSVVCYFVETGDYDLPDWVGHHVLEVGIIAVSMQLTAAAAHILVRLIGV